jgi:hypothetical protein
MPIPDEPFPQADELIDERSSAMEPGSQEPMVDREEDELEFESADADGNDELIDDDDDAVERDTASFGFGDPAD